MKSFNTGKNPTLDEIRRDVYNRCINCERCMAECGFLEEYGKPKHIADVYDPDNDECRKMAFECSLCSLCTAVCPVAVDPVEMFLEMRKNTVSSNGHKTEYSTLTAYEKRGTSRRYTYYALPAGCDTIFFPGCTLTGTRPEQTQNVFSLLQARIPSVGIVLDCCTKPSHDLGRYDYFNRMFSEMAGFLEDHGIKDIVVACPNCHKVFSEYGKMFSVQTIYEIIDQNGITLHDKISGTVTVHDPCPMRFDRSAQDAVRNLIAGHGLGIFEMPHNRDKTLCCGEGGAVACVNGDIADIWRKKRGEEAGKNMMVTYCAGCAGHLKKTGPVIHILDLLYDPKKAMKGKARVDKPPFTYLNRLLFKRKMKKKINAAITRERMFQG
jgi:Fe-S oxidoreductase